MTAEIAGIPAEAQELFAALCAEEPRDAEALAAELSAYVEKIHAAAAASGSFVDAELAQHLAIVSGKLVDSMGDVGETERALIQAAVRYFIVEEDGDGDLTSIIGFDDDAAVLEAVVRHLGRDDLQVRVW